MNFSAVVDYSGDGRYMQREFTRRFISKLTFRADDVVLDVGCGTGEDTIEMAKHVSNVTGVDASEEMLAVAKEINSCKNVTYCQWDARTVGDNPEWRERFDKVVCSYVIHWFPEHTKALAGILACLKPGGELLVIVDRDHSALPQVHEFLKSHTKWGEYVKSTKFDVFPWRHSCIETEQLLGSSGWTNVECETIPPPILGEMRVKLCFKTVMGHTSLISESMQEEYLEDLWQWALSEYEDESQPGLVLFPSPLVIHARKPVTSTESNK